MQQTAKTLLQSETIDAFTPRQSAVLQAALAMLVEGGGRALTTAAVARAANCSKESLYRWFGDRDGLLAAVVTYQASKVRAVTPPAAPAGEAALREQLVRFAHDLLTVLSGDVSLALNRLAIGQAGNRQPQLGQLVLSHGRRPIASRAGTLLDTGKSDGYLSFEDADEAYRTLYGLIVGDAHVRLLLGDATEPPQDLEHQAARAVDSFFRLYGAENPNQT